MVTDCTSFEDLVATTASRLAAADPGLSRTALSQRVCDELNWRGENGRLQEMGCRVLLNRLAAEGRLTLPASLRTMPQKRLRRRNDSRSYRMPESVLASLRDLGELRLVRVTSADRALSAEWTELTARHHYLGAGPLCGRQLRYLVESERFGFVATLAFTSAALHMEARDQWIGWDAEARGLHLDQVVCNARFLVLPWVKVANLASKVLGLCPERVRTDWLAEYGMEPALLETFVDPKRFKGTCYLAAGWTPVGTTKGRGRQDRGNACAIRPKQILLRPLREDFRSVLAAKPPKPPVPVYYTECDARAWTEIEFGGAELGDRRLNPRLETMAAAFFAKPTAGIPEACGSVAAVRAAYRFLGQKDISMQDILAPHHEATAGRVAAAKGVVLAVQDTTYLNYSAHPETEGPGPIGSAENGPVGIVLHDTMAFTPEGTPLGLVHIRCWARDPEQSGGSAERAALPIEEKESFKWIESHRAASELQRRVPDVRVVSVGDREADIYELFEAAAADPGGARVLVRAMHDRKLAGDPCSALRETVASWPVAEVFSLAIPRRGKQPARTVDMELRFGTVEIQAPGKHRKGAAASLRIQVVHAVEQRPADIDEPVEWLLLTDCPAEDCTQAREIVHWYTRRWGVEVYHRVLKSGCRIEDRQLATEKRLERCLAIDLVVAWRLFHLTMLARECPELPAGVCLDEAEWQVLCANFTGALPPQPPPLKQAVIWIGRLGGYVARPQDYLPGTVTMWRGIITLQTMAAGWRLARGMPSGGMPAGP
jgi:hypothetical protein